MAKDWRVPRHAFDDATGGPVAARLDTVLGRIMTADAAASPKVRAGFLQELTGGQRAMLAVILFEMEVNGGGFDSYFRYSGGALAIDALAGLNAIGASRFAKVLAGAAKLFPGGKPPTDTDERAEHLDRILERSPGALEPFESGFFEAYDGEEALGHLQVAYIEAHPAEFFRSGS